MKLYINKQENNSVTVVKSINYETNSEAVQKNELESDNTSHDWKFCVRVCVCMWERERKALKW